MNHFLLRAVDLPILGYMIAYWGGCEIKLRGRLRLLRKVSLLSNPRFRVDRTIESIIESLRSFYRADTCLLILPYGNNGSQLYHLYRADNKSPGIENSRCDGSGYAKVEISRKNGALVLQLKNLRLSGLGDVSFTPKSITERAAALGGKTVVYTNDENETIVSVQIPL